MLGPGRVRSFSLRKQWQCVVHLKLTRYFKSVVCQLKRVCRSNKIILKIKQLQLLQGKTTPLQIHFLDSVSLLLSSKSKLFRKNSKVKCQPNVCS